MTTRLATGLASIYGGHLLKVALSGPHRYRVSPTSWIADTAPSVLALLITLAGKQARRRLGGRPDQSTEGFGALRLRPPRGQVCFRPRRTGGRLLRRPVRRG